MDSITTNMSSLTSEFSNELVIENIQSTSLENFNPIETYQNLVPLPYTIQSQNNGISQSKEEETKGSISNFESFSKNFKKFNSFSQNTCLLKETPRLASLRSSEHKKYKKKINETQNLATTKFSLNLNGKKKSLSSNVFEDLGRITERSKESTEFYEDPKESISYLTKLDSKINAYNVENHRSNDIKEDSIDVLSSNFSTFRDFQNTRNKGEILSKSKETSVKKTNELALNFWKSEQNQESHQSHNSIKDNYIDSKKYLAPILNTFGAQSLDKSAVNVKRMQSNYESDENRKMINPLQNTNEDSYKGTKRKLYKKIKEENNILNESIKKYTETISKIKSEMSRKRLRMKKMRTSIPNKTLKLQELENEIERLQNFNDKMVDQLSTTLETIPLTTKRSDITRKNSSLNSENPIFKFSLENKENSKSVNNIDFSSLVSLGNGTLPYEKPQIFGVHEPKKMYGTLDSGLKRAKMNQGMKVKGIKKKRKGRPKKKFPVLQDKLNKSLVDFFLLDDTGEESSYFEDNNNNILEMK